jgi:hypothetical protein
VGTPAAVVAVDRMVVGVVVLLVVVAVAVGLRVVVELRPVVGRISRSVPAELAPPFMRQELRMNGGAPRCYVCCRSRYWRGLRMLIPRNGSRISKS